MVVAETRVAGARRRRSGRGRPTRNCRSSPAPRRRSAPGAADGVGRGAGQRAWSTTYVRRSRPRPIAPSPTPTTSCSATFDIGRVTAVPMELRSALADYDAATGRYTLYAGSGGAVRQKAEMADVLGIPPDKLRVLSYDVGGNFGSRNRPYVEFGLVLWAAGKLKRPVKYTATRSEAFLTDYQGRDLVTKVALALRTDGRILAMRADNISNVGARCVSLSPLSQGRRADHRLLRHSGRDAAGARGVHQHHADQRLSLVRPAGGDLRHRAADRSRRDRARHRPHRAAAQESRAAEGDALHQRRRHDLRQRHLRGQHGPRHADRRLGRLRERRRAGQEARQAARARPCRTMSNPRSARRASAPRSPCGRRAASTS